MAVHLLDVVTWHDGSRCIEQSASSALTPSVGVTKEEYQKTTSSGNRKGVCGETAALIDKLAQQRAYLDHLI